MEMPSGFAHGLVNFHPENHKYLESITVFNTLLLYYCNYSFYADFGPLNLAMLYRYCCKLNKKLKVY